MQSVIDVGPGYKPPSNDKMRTTLLTEVKAQINTELEGLRGQYKVTGGTLCSDGWTDVKRKPLLNTLFVSPLGQEFVSSIDTNKETKSGQYIADHLSRMIEQVGRANVVQV